MTDHTFLFELRDAAREMQNADYRMLLKDVADKLDSAIDSFQNHPNQETLAEVNGFWSKALRLYQHRPDNAPPPAPLAPAMRMAA